jgi:hypothetical protein
MKEIAEYVSRTYTYRGDMPFIVENEEKFLPEPTKGDVDKLDATGKLIWENQIDEYIKRDIKVDDNCQKLYSLIWG